MLIDTTNWATADKNALRAVANGGHVQSPTYYDLIFRNTAGLQLDHEIESYNATNGTLVAWVRIPSLNPSGDTTIYMYYGNSSITSPTATRPGCGTRPTRASGTCPRRQAQRGMTPPKTPTT